MALLRRLDNYCINDFKRDSEIEFFQQYKYLGVIFDTGGTDDKELRQRVKQARKCIACLTLTLLTCRIW